MVETIQAAWLDFKKTLPEGEPARIVRERRRSFFAGALAVYQVLLVVQDAKMAEGVAVLHALAKELKYNGETVGTAEELRRL